MKLLEKLKKHKTLEIQLMLLNSLLRFCKGDLVTLVRKQLSPKGKLSTNRKRGWECNSEKKNFDE
jgi:hypothetical protein